MKAGVANTQVKEEHSTRMHVMRISNRSQVAFTTCTQGTSSSWEEPVRHLHHMHKFSCMCSLTHLLR